MRIDFLKLLPSLAICFIAAIIGSLFTTPAIPSWYVTLDKPFFSPPNWIFAPVWTTLYFLMGISLYLIWKNPNKEKKHAYYFFAGQLGFNVLWSIFFFGLRNPLLAFLEILILWGFILLTIKAFRRIDTTAAWLLVPYLLWVSFATVLNFSIVLLNS